MSRKQFMYVINFIARLMRFTFISLFLLFGSFTARAQLPYQLMGARAAGMGGASVTMADVWALQYNIGALAGVQEAKVAAGYQTRFDLPELSTAGAVLSWPLTLGVAGMSISRYGFGAYSLQEATLGFAHQIGVFSLGIQGGFVQAGTETIAADAHSSYSQR